MAFSSIRVISTGGLVKVDITPDGTAIKDPSGSSCVCPTSGPHVVLFLDKPTDGSSSRQMDGHTDG